MVLLRAARAARRPAGGGLEMLAAEPGAVGSVSGGDFGTRKPLPLCRGAGCAGPSRSAPAACQGRPAPLSGGLPGARPLLAKSARTFRPRRLGLDRPGTPYQGASAKGAAKDPGSGGDLQGPGGPATAAVGLAL